MVASDAEKRIGQNVAAMRRDMPQQQLADKMRERGHKWSQSTVWAVEKGDRPLRVSESIDLEDIFNVAYTLWGHSGSEVTSVSTAGQQAMDAQRKAVEALADYLKLRVEVVYMAGDLWERRPDLRGRVGGWIRKFAGRGGDLSWMIDEARARSVGDGRHFTDPEVGREYPFKAEDRARLEGDEQFRADLVAKVIEAHGE